MRIKPGSVPRGDDFFDREELVAALLRDLTAGEHVLLAAPRRFGKTAVLQRVLELLPAAWRRLDVRTEDDACPSDVALSLLHATAPKGLDSDLRGELRALPDRLVNELTRLVTKVSVRGVSVELARELDDHWQAIADAAAARIRKHDGPVILAIDELPVALENMQGRDIPRHQIGSLMGWLRELRQTTPALRVALAGSIGFDSILRSLGLDTSCLNDVIRHDVPPFDAKTAREFVAELLGSQAIDADSTVVASIVRQVGLPVPYFLQNFVHQLVQDPLFRSGPRSRRLIRDIYRREIIESPQSPFTWYRDRLEKRYLKRAQAAHGILSELAFCDGPCTGQQLLHLHDRVHGARDLMAFDLLMQDLRADFYVERDARTGAYRFQLPAFRDWWRHWNHRADDAISPDHGMSP